MQNRKKILWLVSWYPNKYDLFDGDFIQRHARAAALYNDIEVVFVKQHTQQKQKEVVVVQGAGLTEHFIYLPRISGPISKWWNHRQWLRAWRNVVTTLIEKQSPHCLHIHIPWKVGLVALWAKKKFGVPYLITEHWGIYNSVVPDNITSWSVVTKFLLKKIFTNASTFVSVSRYVGEGVNTLLLKKQYQFIPNVVDTSLFLPGTKEPEKFQFIHVSNMVALKNIEGILAAFKAFLQITNCQAQLVLIGNRDQHYATIAIKYGLPTNVVIFHGEIPHSEVAAAMRQASVLIVNSDIENSPCVIGEALCTGLPVIATQVGGIPELVTADNSILINPRRNNQLLRAMVDMYKTYRSYNRLAIAQTAKQNFGEAFVGKLHNECYTAIIA